MTNIIKIKLKIKKRSLFLSGATKKLEAKQIGHQDLEPAIVTKNRRYTSQQYLDLHAFSSGLVVNVTRPYIQLELTMREYIQDKKSQESPERRMQDWTIQRIYDSNYCSSEGELFLLAMKHSEGRYQIHEGNLIGDREQSIIR